MKVFIPSHTIPIMTSKVSFVPSLLSMVFEEPIDTFLKGDY